MLSFLTSLLTSYLSIILIFLMSCTFFLILWQRRHLYYCSWKLPGPLSVPLIGAIHLFFKYSVKDSYDGIMDIMKQYPPIFKLWIGPYFFVLTSRVEDAETILPRCLDKGKFYLYFGDYFKQSLLVAPLDVWKNRRKIINQSFNIKIIHSFLPILFKHAKQLNKSLEKHCNINNPSNVFHTVWKFTFNVSCETICEADPKFIKNKDLFLEDLESVENKLIERFANLLLHVPLFWKISRLRKQLLQLTENASDFVEEVIKLKFKNPEEKCHNDTDKKRFLNHLLKLYEAKKIDYNVLLEETPLMLFASSETSAVTISYFLLVMSFNPNIQEKIYEELVSIFRDNKREITVEDLNRMEYLERCIKETLRLFPPVPFILRTLDKNVTVNDIEFPKNTRMCFVIAEIHRRPDIWPEPLKFDPDRFLPEEIQKRSRCSFIPFSFGARNCIGAQYAMFSLKIMLATIFQNYRVANSVDYNKIEDIDQVFTLVVQTKKGFRIVLEKR